MPTKSRSSDTICNELVAQAVAADHAKDYAAALVLYRTAIGTLLEKVEKTRNNQHKRQQLKSRIKELLRRAENLQRYLDTPLTQPTTPRATEERTSSPTMQATVKKSSPRTAAIQPRTTSTSKAKGLTNPSNDADHRDNNDEVCNGISNNDEALREKEWSFNLDLNFNIKSKLKAPTPASSDTEGNGAEPSHIIKLLRLLGR